MSVYDDILAGAFGDGGGRPAPRVGRSVYDDILDSSLPDSDPFAPEPDPNDPFASPIASIARNVLTGGVGGSEATGALLHNTIGLPKRGVDWLAREGARAQGLNVADDATVGQMVRSAAGLNNEGKDAGYGARLGGKALEFVSDVALDPTTYPAFGLGLGEKAGRLASGVIAGSLASGAVTEGTEAVRKLVEQGMTPEAAEALFGAALSTGMAGLVTSHAARPHVPAAAQADPFAAPIDTAPTAPVADPFAAPIVWDRPTPPEFTRPRYEGVLPDEVPPPVNLPAEAAPFDLGTVPPLRVEPGRPPAPPASAWPVEEVGLPTPRGPERREVNAFPEMNQRFLEERRGPEPPPPPRGPDRREVSVIPEAQRRAADRRAALAEEIGLPPEHPAVERVVALEQELRTDPLTSLGNKRAWEEMQSSLTDQDRSVMVDLKRFKEVNDTYGHDAGDAVLKATGEVLTEFAGPDSARFGGDEFGAIFRGLSDEQAQTRAAEMQAALAKRTVRVQRPDGTEVDIPGIQAHIGVGTNAREADLAANAAAAESRKTGRAGVPPVAESVPGAAGSLGGRGADRPVAPLVPREGQSVEPRAPGVLSRSDEAGPDGGRRPAEAEPARGPSLGEGAGREDAQGLPGPVRGLGQQAQAIEGARDAKGRIRWDRVPEPPRDERGGRILPGQESWTPEERAAVHGLADYVVREVDSMERAEPTGRRPVLDGEGRQTGEWYGIGSKKSGTALEDLPYSPKEMRSALERDKGNPVELDVHEAMRRDPRVDEILEQGERDSVAPEGDVDTSFNPSEMRYSVRPAAGQRGLEGIADDVAPRERQRETGPKQESLFGGRDMLQGTERKGTEGREGSGPLFTQAQDARAKAEEKAQGGIKFSAKPDERGFFSQLRRAVDETKQPAASGSNWSAYLRDQKRGVKAEEMKWTGLDEFLSERAGQKVTKQEIQEFLDQNEVRVEEVTLGVDTATTKRLRDIEVKQDELERLRRESGGDLPPDRRTDAQRARIRELDDEGEALGQEHERIGYYNENAPKFSQYTLPGGENYREVLLKLPRKALSEKAQARYQAASEKRGRLMDRLDEVRDTPAEAEVRRQIAAMNTELSEATRGLHQEENSQTFRSSHFDEPNILAHVRLNDRTDADGKRVLFVEEIQSDWAQKGRRDGFDNEAAFQELVRQRDAAPDDSPQQEALQRQIDEMARTGGKGVPSAPFVGKTEAWTELALKRVLRMAAEEGYDRVAWTTGEQQAARYDLSKQVKALYYKKNADGTYRVFAEHKSDGRSTNLGETLKAADLPDAIGKDVAERIVNGEGAEANLGGGGSSQRDIWTSLSGDGLKVGGEGMKGFYDKILPSVAGKLGKKWGAKVGETGFATEGYKAEQYGSEWLLRRPDGSVLRDSTGDMALYRSKASAEAAGKVSPGKGEVVHSMDVTPQMRASVMEGQPLFRATGDKATAPGVTTEMVKKAFAAGGIKEVGKGAWDVRLPNERYVRVRVRPEGIEYNAEAFQKGYQRPKAEAEQIVGAWQKVGRDGLVWLAKEADQGTVHHEAFHGAMDLALSPKEKAAVLKKYGNEEAAAEAYAKWQPAKTANSWFSKILATFKRLYRSFRPSWESAFERTRSGEAYGKASAKEAGAPKYATAPKTPPAMPTPKPQTTLKAVPPQPAQASPQAKSGPRFSIPEETRLQTVQRLVQDKMNRVSTVQRAVIEQGGKAGQDIKSLADAFTPKAAERVSQVEREYVDPLVKGIASEGFKLEDLDRYLYAKHAPTRNKVISDRTNGQVTDGSGMSNADAAKALADFQAKGHTAKLDKLAQIVRDMREKQVETLLDGGLISKEQAKAWHDTMGDDYVPLRSAEVDEGIGTGQGFDIRGKEAKAATGRKSAADSPATAMVQQLQRAIVRAEKNKVDQAFAEFVEANPDPSLWEMDAKHTRRELGPDGQVREVGDPFATTEDFHYKVDGETKRITIKDPLLDRAMKNLSAKEMGKVVNAVGSFTRLYSQMVTSWNPEFLATNFARDIQSALGNVSVEQGGKVAASMAKNIPVAMKGMYKSLADPKSTDPVAKMAREFREDGGSVGWFSIRDLPALEKSLTRKVERSGPGAVNTGIRAISGVAGFVERANKTVEGGTRFALYKALRDSGTPRERAASVARNVTIDFNKKGELGPGVNALYAFFNANIQGGKRIVDILKTPKGKALAGGIMASGWALDQYNRAAAGDANNDGTNDYDDIPEYVKERNLVIMRGKGDKPLLLPMPYGFNVIHTAGRQASAAMSGATTPVKAAMAVGSSAANAFNPLGSEAGLVQMLSPTFLDPIVQDATNRDFTDKPIRPEGYPGSAQKPPSERYYKNVNPMAREVAKWLNEKTGGDRVTPGYVSVSPETLDHYFSFATGGLGRFVKNAAATGSALAKGETPELRNVPFARRFVYEANPGQTGQKYRETEQAVENLKQRVKTYQEERNTAKLRKIPRAWMRSLGELNQIDTAIRRLRRSPSPSAAKQIERLQNRANRVFAETSRAAGPIA